MWQLFVVGPIAARGGVIQQCLSCRAGSGGSSACTGFGPGCLVHPESPPARADRPKRDANRAPR